MKSSNDAHVTLGQGVVTVKRDGSSAVVLANILGTETAGGEEKIYLDRLVHKVWEGKLGEFAASGAISTVLTRPVSQQ